MTDPNPHPNLTTPARETTKQATNKQQLWKDIMLEFLHNYFIGISKLECSNPNCPLLLIWDQIEEKLSKKGKGATVKIDSTKFLVVDLLTYQINGLEEITEVTIQYRDGKPALVRTPAEIQELSKNLSPEELAKLEFLDPSEVVYWFNNPAHTPNLQGAEEVYLNDLWNTKQDIKWDQEKAKKKVFLHVENDPSGQTQATSISASQQDYLFYVADPSITNPIKKMEVYSPGTGTQERQQLWADYKEDLSELRRVMGVRHNTAQKEDRQNNPELEMVEAQFIALERRKQRIREESIKEAEDKGFCPGTHILTYGSHHAHSPTEIQEEILPAEADLPPPIEIEQT